LPDPITAGERGANENLNGLIRRYIPKKANFDDYTDKENQSIEQQINLRPRKRCNFVSPIEMFNPKVAFAI
jgi:IS30 family transposase